MTTSNISGSNTSSATEEASLAGSIQQLLHKIDSLERKVDMLQRTMQETPGMAAMATDIVDEALRNARDSGVDVGTHLKNTVQLVHRLTDNTTLANLEKLMDLTQEAPGLLSMIVDILDAQLRSTAASGIDIEARLTSVLGLLTKLTDPVTIQALQEGIDTLSAAPGLFSMATDIVDAQMDSAASTGIDIGARAKGFLTLANRLSDPNTTTALEHVLEPRAVSAIGALGTAIAESKDQPHNPVGPMGLLRALRDPDVQRATSYLVEIAKRMGQELK